MTATPSYASLAKGLQQAKLTASVAELYGTLCGSLTVANPPTEAATLAHLAGLVGVSQWPVALVGDWKQLRTQILAQYQSETLDFELLLPAGDVVARAKALAEWCEGFMSGFADHCASKQLPRSVNEAMSDLMAIRQMEEPEGSEEEREALTHIEEHCRMLALSIFTDMALQNKESSS